MRKAFTLTALILCLSAALTQLSYAQSRARRVGQSPPSASTTPAPSSAPARTPSRSNDAQSGATPSSSAKQIEEEVGENEVVRVNTTLVTLPVSVLDRDGRYIPNLRQEDFRIFEDGVEHEVAYFAAVEQPFTVALVLDTSGSTQFKLDEIQDAAIAFVDQLRPDDRVIVVAFDDDIQVLAEATSDRRVLRDAIRRTSGGGSTKLYDAVDFVIKKRLNRIKGRKAIVLFTDGVDTASGRATYDSTVLDAEELDAIIYPVQYDTYDSANRGNLPWPTSRRNPSIIIPFPFPFPMPIPGGRRGGGAGTSRGDYARASAYLRDLAYKTGGRVYEANSLRYVEEAFINIAEELRRQYSLGYYPKEQANVSARRQIKVRVKRPNLVVRTRDSYIYKPSGDSTTSTAQQEEQRQSSPPELRKRPFTANNQRSSVNNE